MDFDTYSGLTDPTLSEFIEVNEEFLDSHSVLGDQRLQSLFNVQFNVHECGLPLLG